MTDGDAERRAGGPGGVVDGLRERLRAAAGRGVVALGAGSHGGVDAGGLDSAVVAASTRGPGERTRAEQSLPSGRRLVLPPASGTLLAVDTAALVALGSRHDLVLALERRVGAFATAGTPLLSWWSATERVPSEAEERAHDSAALAAVTLGAGPAGDVDSRLLALAASAAPGDLDALASALALLARLPDPPAAVQDPEGFLRLIVPESPFESRLAAVSQALVAHAGSAPLVAERSLLLLRDCAFTATLPRRRAAVADARDRLRAAAAGDPGRLDALAAAIDAALEGRWSVV